MASLTPGAVEQACEEYSAGKGSQGKGKGGSDFRHSEYVGEGGDLEAPVESNPEDETLDENGYMKR